MNREQDTVGHSGIQPHSMGEYFPAVIAVVERRDLPTFRQWAKHQSPHARDTGVMRTVYDAWCDIQPWSRSYELRIGAYCEEYATRDDAEKVARYVCQGGQIIPERYAELMSEENASIRRAMAPDVPPADVLGLRP